MNIVRINQKSVDAKSIEKVVDQLRSGKIIGYPTETVYGLGGDGMNEKVIDHIYRLKGRSTQTPFPLLIGRTEDVSRLTRTISLKAEALMEQFWPGPLTLVFDGSPFLPSLLTGREGKVGLRLSSDSICQAILMKFEKPLISTSANPSGQKPAQSASQVLDYFGNRVDLIVDGGEKKSDRPSTVIDVSRTMPRIIREGVILKDRIEKIVGPLDG